MDFNLTEEHKLIRQGVQEFCDKYVCPIADAVDQEPRFPAETMKKLAEQDWLGIPYPVEYGGAGADYLSYIIVLEELAGMRSDLHYRGVSHLPGRVSSV